VLVAYDLSVCILWADLSGHRGEDAAVEGTAHGRPLLIDGATPLTEMNAGSVRTPLEQQLALRAPLSQQVGQALPNSSAGLISGKRLAAGWILITERQSDVGFMPHPLPTGSASLPG
jgi:hypothetical protein